MTIPDLQTRENERFKYNFRIMGPITIVLHPRNAPLVQYSHFGSTYPTHGNFFSEVPRRSGEGRLLLCHSSTGRYLVLRLGVLCDLDVHRTRTCRGGRLGTVYVKTTNIRRVKYHKTMSSGFPDCIHTKEGSADHRCSLWCFSSDVTAKTEICRSRFSTSW